MFDDVCRIGVDELEHGACAISFLEVALMDFNVLTFLFDAHGALRVYDGLVFCCGQARCTCSTV